MREALELHTHAGCLDDITIVGGSEIKPCVDIMQAVPAGEGGTNDCVHVCPEDWDAFVAAVRAMDAHIKGKPDSDSDPLNDPKAWMPGVTAVFDHDAGPSAPDAVQ